MSHCWPSSELGNGRMTSSCGRAWSQLPAGWTCTCEPGELHTQFAAFCARNDCDQVRLSLLKTSLGGQTWLHLKRSPLRDKFLQFWPAAAEAMSRAFPSWKPTPLLSESLRNNLNQENVATVQKTFLQWHCFTILHTPEKTTTAICQFPILNFSFYFQILHCWKPYSFLQKVCLSLFKQHPNKEHSNFGSPTAQKRVGHFCKAFIQSI